MKRPAFIAGIVLLAGVVAFSCFWRLHKNRARHKETSSSTLAVKTVPPLQMPSARIPTSTNSQTTSVATMSVAADSPALSLIGHDAKQRRAADADPELLTVKQILRDYRAAFGENPVGTNSEITKTLLGANSRRARFISTEARLNSSRQLVDRWNHPYFFHQLSRVRMEIRSAGPDGVMWTTDDEVSR